MAIDDINSNLAILPDATLKLANYSHFNTASSIKAAMRAATDSIHFAVGEVYSSMTLISAAITSAYKIPQFSPYSGDPSLSKRSQYPYFWRSFGEASTTNAIVAFLRNYNFTRVGLLSENIPISTATINYLASALQAYNISIVSQQTFTIANWDGSTAAKDLQYPLQMLKEAEARIIISIHQGYNGYLVLNEADRNGMVGPDYFWIFGSGIEDTSYGMFTHKELEEGFPGYPKTPRFPELTRGLMTLLRDDYDYLANEDFLKRYRPMVKDLIVRLNDTALKSVLWDDANEKYPNMALLDTYDAIWAFASTVDRVINLKNKTSADFVTANGISSADITLKQWVDTNYQGVTGNLRIDTKTGTRISKMTLMQYTGMFWNVSSYDPSAVWKLAQVGNVTAAGKISMSSASSSPEPFIANYNLKNLIWPGNRTTPPLDHVVYTDELVYGSSAGIGMAVTYAIFIFIYFISIPLIIYHRNHTIIRRKSPVFCIQVLLGLIMFKCVVFLELAVPTTELCIASRWLQGVGFAIFMGSLLAKTWRIWKIFDNPKLEKRIFTDIQLLQLEGLFVFLEIIILIIWSALDHDGVYKYSDRIRFTNIILCNNPDMNQAQVAMTATIISYNGVLTLLTALLAYLTRNVPSSFREAKLLGFATYNTVIIGLFLVLQQYIMNQTVGIVKQFLVRRILILISGIFTYGCTVGINLYLVMIAKVQSGGENDLGTKTLKKAQKDAVSSPPSFLGQTDNTANNPSSGKYSNVSTQKSGNGNENQVGMTSTIFSNSPISQTTMSMKNESKLIDSWRQVNVWWIPGSVAQIAISSLDASVSHVIPINQIKEISVVDYNGVDDKDTIVVQWGQQKLLLQCDTAELAADWGNTIKEHQNMLQSKA